MNTYKAGVCMPHAVFVTGDWHEHIHRAAALKHSWMREDQDFAAASTHIVEMLVQQMTAKNATEVP